MVLIVGEERQEKIAPITYDLIGEGKELAEKIEEGVDCAYIGNRKNAGELLHYGLDRVFLLESDEFIEEEGASSLASLIEKIKPTIVLIGATNRGRSLAPRLAVKLETGLTADCTGLEINEKGEFLQIRPAFGGNVMATIVTKTLPKMATVRYKVMDRAHRTDEKSGSIQDVEPVPYNKKKILNLYPIEERGDITEAEIIISGGKGLGKKDGFKLIEEFANVLGGVVGASRKAVDDGWIDYSHQVGLSGRTVKPKLYIACGISGSVQHLAGMQTSEHIVAINENEAAPIFKVADVGILGDLYEIIPRLIDEVEEYRKKMGS